MQAASTSEHSAPYAMSQPSQLALQIPCARLLRWCIKHLQIKLDAELHCHAVPCQCCTAYAALCCILFHHAVLSHILGDMTLPVIQHGWEYLDNATDDSLPALLDKAQGGDVIQHVLQVASWAGVGVDATDSHIALCVHVTKLNLQETMTVLDCAMTVQESSGWNGCRLNLSHCKQDTCRPLCSMLHNDEVVAPDLTCQVTDTMIAGYRCTPRAMFSLEPQYPYTCDAHWVQDTQQSKD